MTSLDIEPRNKQPKSLRDYSKVSRERKRVLCQGFERGLVNLRAFNLADTNHFDHHLYNLADWVVFWYRLRSRTKVTL
jgi:hypothetical protein